MKLHDKKNSQPASPEDVNTKESKGKKREEELCKGEEKKSFEIVPPNRNQKNR
jgi:hypothetical protein